MLSFSSRRRHAIQGVLLLFISNLYSDFLRNVACATNSTAVEQACRDGSAISIAWWIQEPYAFKGKQKKQGILLDIFEKEIRACCKAGLTISYLTPESEKISTDTVLAKRPNHIVLPVGRNAGKTNTVFGRPFVGLVESPGIAVVIAQTISGADLLTAIVNSWPILIFIVTTLSLSGLVMWLLEYRYNEEDFPECFPYGVFEGFWWAAVTMTTVGYGDKVPKSILGRLFAVLWINAGLVIIAMFMGIVTASLNTSTVTSHLYGIGIAAKNGSPEYQYAVFQSADVKAKQTFEDMYSSVAAGETQAALVDLYTTTTQGALFTRHRLYVAMVIDHPVVYGVVLPQQTQRLKQCLKKYEETHKEESYFAIHKYLTHAKAPVRSAEDGTDYFNGSMFGYSVYAMTGLFLILLGVGLWWQHYWQPRRGEWKEEQERQNTEMKEINVPSTEDFSDLSTPAKHDTSTRTRNTPIARRGTEKLMAQQSSEILRITDEYKSYRQSWQQSFRLLQERHRKEQIAMFQLDNCGYDM